MPTVLLGTSAKSSPMLCPTEGGMGVGTQTSLGGCELNSLQALHISQCASMSADMVGHQ